MIACGGICVPNNISFLKLGKKNRRGFEQFFNGLSQKEFSLNDICFGIIDGEQPCGVVVLKKDSKTLIIDSIEIDYAVEDIENTMKEVLSGIVENVHDWGFEDLSLKYSDNSPGIRKSILRKAGFVSFKEEAKVYSISDFSLGTLLRDGPDAITMRAECVRLLKEKRARIFNLAPETAVEKYKELSPDPAFSFLTLNENGEVGGCSIVSTLPDGTHYLSELISYDGNSDDMIGLLFLSLSNIFMDIYPGGEFFIPAVKPYIITVFRFLLAPLEDGIEQQRIFTATTKNDNN